MIMADELFNFRKNALGGVLTSPLCEEYRKEWQLASKDKLALITLAMRQQSCPYFAHHCYMGKGLSKEYIKREFADYINGYTIKDADDVIGYTYGLFVDYNYDNNLIVDKDVVHIMWTNCNVVIPETKCPVVYVSNNSNVTLSCDGFNSVKIYLFDNSRLVIDDVDKESDVTIYKYSDFCVIEKGRYCFGAVKEFKKELRL